MSVKCPNKNKFMSMSNMDIERCVSCGNKTTVSSLSCQQRALSDYKTTPKLTNCLVFLRHGEVE